MNAFEITDVSVRRFPGLYRVQLKAHARHIKRTPFLRDVQTAAVAGSAYSS